MDSRLIARRVRMTTTTMNLSVTGDQQIHCDGCEHRISQALERLDSVTIVETGGQSQCIVIETDPIRTGSNQLRERLDLLGYDASEETT